MTHSQPKEKHAPKALKSAMEIWSAFKRTHAGTREFRAQLPGAALAAIAWAVLSFGFRVYVESFSNYTLLYGSLAAVALFLFWMYLVFYILLAGAFINHYWATQAHGKPAENV